MKNLQVVKGIISEAIDTIETLNFNGLQRNTINSQIVRIGKEALDSLNTEKINTCLELISTNENGFKYENLEEKTAWFCEVAKILISN